jgi:transcriptional regulator with XRE-family HTH domain
MTNLTPTLWPTSEWEMPQRSRLYSINPMGKGTAMVEALHSLVIRLAHAHVVKPSVLVKEEILRDCDINCTKYSAKFVTTYLSTMNGLGKYAAEITSSLERLTMQAGLDECTFLKWNQLFDYRARRLLHLHPHWCPACFEDWRQGGVEPYFPLIWQSAIVRHCPVHHVPLEERCPSCQKTQPFVPRHYYLDHCSYCGNPLAQQGDVRTSATDTARVPAEARRAIDAVSEMITRGSSIQHLLTAEHFWKQVQQVADRFYEGKIKSFEKAIGFAEGTFSNWKLGRHKPSFSALYRFAHRLDTTPVGFLVGGVPDSFRPSVKAGVSKRSPVRLPPAERDRLRNALREIIAGGYSYRPMRDIAVQLGYRHSFLIYWFRDECRQISSLYRKSVASQAEARTSANQNLARHTIEKLYASRLRVTRRLMDEALSKVGLSLQDPVVREAVYAVRTAHVTSSTPPAEIDG